MTTRILFVESGSQAGGSFESMYQHVRAIDRDRFEPVVVFLNPTPYVDRIRDLGVRVEMLTDPLYSTAAPTWKRRWLDRLRRRLDAYLPGLYVPFDRWIHRPTIRALVDIVERREIDLIHLNNQPNRDIYGLAAAERAGIPCVSHLRSVNRVEGFDARRAAYANRVADVFVSNLRFTRRFWEDHRLDPGKIRDVHNGIRVRDVEPADLSRWLDDPEDAYIVSCIARLTPGKGHGFLLEGFAELRRAQPDVKLLIAGDGVERERLTRKARKLDLDGDVVFTGHLEDAPRLVAASDVSVSPSPEDSFGRVVLESIMAKTPVVASDAGSIREILQDGENGLLVQPGDVDGLVRAIQRLREAPAERDRMVKAAYRDLLEGFTIERYAEQMAGIYQEVLEGRSGSRAGT